MTSGIIQGLIPGFHDLSSGKLLQFANLKMAIADLAIKNEDKTTGFFAEVLLLQSTYGFDKPK